jgi:hypothetical protein
MGIEHDARTRRAKLHPSDQIRSSWGDLNDLA